MQFENELELRKTDDEVNADVPRSAVLRRSKKGVLRLSSIPVIGLWNGRISETADKHAFITN